MTKKQLEAPYIPTRALPTTRAQVTLSFDSLAFAVKFQIIRALPRMPTNQMRCSGRRVPGKLCTRKLLPTVSMLASLSLSVHILWSSSARAASVVFDSDASLVPRPPPPMQPSLSQTMTNPNPGMGSWNKILGRLYVNWCEGHVL